jgi:probable rRNA maturation factor
MPAAVRNDQRRVRLSLERVRATAERALAAMGQAGAEVHVALVDDAAMRRLHGRYLGERTPTDVMAFPLNGPGPVPLLGEVVVSAQTAARHARRLGVPVALEVDLLVVHGLLHLLGYDDGEADAARRMHERARELLSAGRSRPLPSRLWTDLL